MGEIELDVELEMNRITLAGMTGASELHTAVTPLVKHYGIESTAPAPLDIAKELQQLTVEYMSGTIEDNVRDQRLIAIIQKAMVSSDPLVIEQSQEEAQ